jgi:DNA-binding NarL/FixJ family response regulator
MGESSPNSLDRMNMTTQLRAQLLTPHHHRLAAMAMEGRTNAQIAETLGVTRRAIEAHFTNIYRTLGISRRGQLHSALRVGD